VRAHDRVNTNQKSRGQSPLLSPPLYVRSFTSPSPPRSSAPTHLKPRLATVPALLQHHRTHRVLRGQRRLHARSRQPSRRAQHHRHRPLSPPPTRCHWRHRPHRTRTPPERNLCNHQRLRTRLMHHGTTENEVDQAAGNLKLLVQAGPCTTWEMAVPSSESKVGDRLVSRPGLELAGCARGRLRRLDGPWQEREGIRGRVPR